MALVSLNLNPTQKVLKDFGDIALAMLNVLGLLFLWLGKIHTRGLIVFCLLGLLVYGASRISTRLIKPVYQGLMIVTFPIGWVVSHVVMAIFYYGVITPVACFFKFKGRDIMSRRYDSQAETYWLPYAKKRTLKDYFNQT